MITTNMLYNATLELYRKAMFTVPEDIETAYREVYELETDKAKEEYDFAFAAMANATKEGLPLCMDSGTICFYITLGTSAKLDPEMDIRYALAKATKEATEEGILSPYTVDPLTRENTNVNLGVNMPSLEYNIATGEGCVEMTVVLKGGGAELSGSDFRMLFPAEGERGIKKFVLDQAIKGSKYGGSCPPNIYGVGFGGSMAIATRLAMESCHLRPYGSRHPIQRIADLEQELRNEINSVGAGIAGKGCGKVTAMDVHIEFSYGQSAHLPVALVSQCFIVHRATANLSSEGIQYASYPELWFNELRKSIPKEPVNQTHGDEQ